MFSLDSPIGFDGMPNMNRRKWERGHISGTILWLNAQRGSDLRDLSGRGNNPTVNSAPSLNTGGPGGRAYWTFNGATPNYVTFPDVFSALTVAECFLVVKRTDNTSGHDGLWTFGSAGVDARFPFPGDGQIYDDWGTNIRKTTGVPTNSPVTDYIIYNVLSKSGNWTSWINGTQHFTTASNTVGFKTSCIWGKGPSGVLGYFSSPELLVFNRELAAWERSLVTNDLGREFNIAVP